MRLNNKRYVRLKSLFHKWNNSTRLVAFDVWEFAHITAMVEFSEMDEPQKDRFARVSEVILEFGEFDPWFKFDETKLRDCLARLQMGKVLDHEGKVVRPVDSPSLFDRYMAAHDLISVCLNRRRKEGRELSKADWSNFPTTDDEKDAWSFFIAPENLEVFTSMKSSIRSPNVLIKKAFAECKRTALKRWLTNLLWNPRKCP